MTRTGDFADEGNIVSRLYLLRHAKAVRPKPDMRDFDRSLDEQGRADAIATGEEMRRRGYIPDATICSGSLRTRETLQAVADEIDVGEVTFCDVLYSAGADGYLSLIQEYSDSGSVLVIGHNPSIESLTMALVDDGEPTARAALVQGMPTSGLAVIDFPGSLATAGSRRGYLETFLSPHRR